MDALRHSGAVDGHNWGSPRLSRALNEPNSPKVRESQSCGQVCHHLAVDDAVKIGGRDRIGPECEAVAKPRLKSFGISQRSMLRSRSASTRPALAGTAGRSHE